MTNKKPNIVISIPLVWSIRNFILSGVINKLENHYNIYYFIPEDVKEILSYYNISEEKIISVPPIELTKMSQRLFSIQRVIFQNKYNISTYGVFNRFNKKRSRSLKSKLFSFAVIFFSFYFFKNILKFISDLLFDASIDKSIYSKLEEINPLFGLSTCCVSSNEWPLLRALKNSDIKIVAHVLSFDNITSRGYVPIDYFDQYFVWNEKMRRELSRFYGIKKQKIKITGSPQFDFHTQKKFELKKQYISKKVGLSRSNYILYCANHFALTPNEPNLFKYILKQLEEHDFLSKLDIVLRLHPMDKFERWEKILKRSDNVYLNEPWPAYNKNYHNWGIPSVEDIIFYPNLIKHSSVVLNIASTVSIDAAILDIPTICIGFHPENKKEGKFYHDLHFTEHYKDITSIGSVDLATDKENFIELFEKNISDKSLKKSGRQSLVKFYFGDSTIGQSSNIIVNNLIEHSLKS